MAAPRPRAAVLAIGSELLALGRTDTNSPEIAAALQRHGVEVRFTAVVGDELDALEDALRHALARADLVVCTGGLGPTDDDRTRSAVAAVLGLGLAEDAAVARRRSAPASPSRQLAMPEINRRQALVPDGASVLANTRGTAPGPVDPDRAWRAAAAAWAAARDAADAAGGAAALRRAAVGRHAGPAAAAGRRRPQRVVGRRAAAADLRRRGRPRRRRSRRPSSPASGSIEVHLSAAGDDARGARRPAGRRRRRRSPRRSATTSVSVDGRGLEAGPWATRCGRAAGGSASPSRAPAAWSPRVSPTSPAAAPTSIAASSSTATPPRSICWRCRRR